jgi:hypothetical protein
VPGKPIVGPIKIVLVLVLFLVLEKLSLGSGLKMLTRRPFHANHWMP